MNVIFGIIYVVRTRNDLQTEKKYIPKNKHEKKRYPIYTFNFCCYISVCDTLCIILLVLCQMFVYKSHFQNLNFVSGRLTQFQLHLLKVCQAKPHTRRTIYLCTLDIYSFAFIRMFYCNQEQYRKGREKVDEDGRFIACEFRVKIYFIRSFQCKFP